MSTRTATIIGATGLIGNHIWQLLKEDAYFDTIRLLVRRPFAHNDPKTEAKLIDFTDSESLAIGIYDSDAIFCAVGTTQKKVRGDKVAYRKIDFDIPVKAARFAKEQGRPSYLLVSSAGANVKIKNFYLQLKGETEEAIKNLQLPSASIFRPSILLGERKEKRAGERMGQVVMQSISFLLPDRYKPIEAVEVAKAMIAASKIKLKGFNMYEYAAMKKLALDQPIDL